MTRYTVIWYDQPLPLIRFADERWQQNLRWISPVPLATKHVYHWGDPTSFWSERTMARPARTQWINYQHNHGNHVQFSDILQQAGRFVGSSQSDDDTTVLRTIDGNRKSAMKTI